jgi:release factor glutamine methyltransferase
MHTDIVTRLRDAGCVFAEDEAGLLISAARTPGELDEMVGRRVAGLPLEQVVGWAEFCGLRIAVEPGVFVPRRRTEFLARQAAALAGPGDVVVDLCCGAGAIAAAVAGLVPGVQVFASDIDPVAVRCARRNVPGQVYQGDLYDPLPDSLRGRVRVLTANVPYVPAGEIGLLPAEAREHEPLVALNGGPDGLDVLRRVAAGAPDWLAAGGYLLTEATERQVPAAVEALSDPAGAGLAVRVARSAELDAVTVIGMSLCSRTARGARSLLALRRGWPVPVGRGACPVRRDVTAGSVVPDVIPEAPVRLPWRAVSEAVERKPSFLTAFSPQPPSGCRGP